MNSRILVVDDEQNFLDSVRRGLIISGFKNVTVEADPRRAVWLFENGENFDIALIDITMPGMNGIELLEHVRNTSPTTECLMVTAVDEAITAVECIKKGAYDYLLKPISKENLVASINRALERKRLYDILDIGKSSHPPELEHTACFRPIVTSSNRMFKILREAELHARSNVPILITGDSGTGKELLARAIHEASSRAESPFLPINMAALPAHLFESGFFGHMKGAFTGAEKQQRGYLEAGDGGTLFLDEIGNLPLGLQGKLLRVFQDGEYTMVGSTRPRKTNARFVAATNADLNRLMEKNLFRKDLYYRLRGAWLHLPPLRERKEDIPLLINHFLMAAGNPTARLPRGKHGIEKTALNHLMAYNYPGNVRELESIIYSAVNLSRGRPITLHCLPSHIRKLKTAPKKIPTDEIDGVLALDQVEKSHILRVYRQTGHNKSQSARLLNIGLNTLRRKLEKYKVE